MNLVAHQLLSFNQPLVQVGNHLGEIVRGKNMDKFSPNIIKGIKLHRHIDSFTDSHEIVKKSTARLHRDFGKYSPIIVDIFYDYFLIKNWNKFSNESFENFKNRCYKLLLDHKESYPEKLKYLTEALVKYDWFQKYSTLDGIEDTLKQMSVRTKFVNNMDSAVKTLYIKEESFNQDFLLFFPKIVQSCKEFLAIK